MQELLTKENPFLTHYRGEEAESRRPLPVRPQRKSSNKVSTGFSIELSLVPNHAAFAHIHEEVHAQTVLDNLYVGSYSRGTEVRSRSDYDINVVPALYGQQPDLKRVVQLIKQWRRRTPAVAEKEIDHLRSIYILREPNRIIAFILENQFLLNILSEAPQRIHKCFGSEVQLALQLSHDPEDTGSHELFIRILTKSPASQAFALLERLDEEWWLDASDKAEGKLNLRLEYI